MKQDKVLNVAIVGGGPGCKAIMDMIFADKLSQLQMNLIGIACTNPKAVGYEYAREKGIYTTRDYSDLFALKDLDMIIELTGHDEVTQEIARSKPDRVRLVDHVAARLFWDIFQIEEQRLLERMEAMNALQYSEDKYRSLFNNAQVGMFQTRVSDGKMLECNGRLAEMFAYESREACLAEFVTAEHYLDPGTRERMLAEMQETGEINNFEARLSRNDGAVIWVRYSARIYPDKGCIEGVATDITDEKRAVEAVVEAKEDWENTFDAITDMVMLLDDKHQIIRVNRAAAEGLGTNKESLVGKQCYEAVHGQNHPTRGCPLVRTMKTLGPHTTELTEPRLGGTFICSTSPILNRAGELTGYTHSLKDITEPKRLEAQLQHAQRMEAIGTLAGGIAHDFNNVLMGIQGNTSLVSLHTDPDHPHFGHLKAIEDMVQRGAELTRQLLGFARGGKYEVKPSDLNEIVEKSSEMFGRTKKEVKVHTKHQKDIWPVEVDQAQIEQVLLNLYVNAWQAMPDGGDLYVETKNVALDDSYAMPFGVGPGNYVKISVTDTGVGMDKETQQRVFDPFFTTKEIGRGTGLGLSSAYGIIRNHGGIINVYSEKGKGTTFSTYLPASEKEIPVTEKELSDEVLRGTETILFADDEEGILEVGKQWLKEMGYEVMLAASGKEAVETYEEHKDEIDLVILDMIMPEMGGGEAYDRIKEANPQVKALLSSGYSIDGQANEILERGCNGFIQKPFDMKTLSLEIREILDRE
ncbi:MAG: PAS domain S-box protein [Deltaproteobacteria bacterium]|nr:PAS domain S-box protein [Deltaproteobacteria bacterium]